MALERTVSIGANTYVLFVVDEARALIGDFGEVLHRQVPSCQLPRHRHSN